MLTRNKNIPLIYADLSKTLGIVIFSSTAHILEQTLVQTFTKFPCVIAHNFEPYGVYRLNERGCENMYSSKTSEGSPVNRDYDIHNEEYNFDDAWMAPSYNSGGYTSYPNTRGLVCSTVSRVPDEIKEKFRVGCGYGNYMHFLRQFADKYFGNEEYKTRADDISVALAEDFLEHVWESEAFTQTLNERYSG